MAAPSELSFARLSRVQGRALGEHWALGWEQCAHSLGLAQSEAFGFYLTAGVGHSGDSKWGLGALPLGWPSDLLLTSRI